MTLTITRVGKDTKPFLNLLVYGMPGVGKTTFAAQAQDHPDLAPVLFADLEGGLLSVAGRGDVDAVAVRSSDDMEELFWELRSGNLRNAEGLAYRTIVIDSGTNLSNRVLEEWVARNHDRELKKGKGKDRTIDDIQIEDYGKMGAQVRRLIAWYRDLPMNLIVTALARFEFPQNADKRTSAPISVGPEFIRSLSMNVTGLMDHVWYLYVDENGRGMLTTEQGVFRAKTRGANFSPALGHFVENPYLPDLYDLLISTESNNESGGLSDSLTIEENDPIPGYVDMSEDEDADYDGDDVSRMTPEQATLSAIVNESANIAFGTGNDEDADDFAEYSEDA